MLTNHILQLKAVAYFKRHNMSMNKKVANSLIGFGVSAAGYRSLRNIYAGVFDMF